MEGRRGLRTVYLDVNHFIVVIRVVKRELFLATLGEERGYIGGVEMVRLGEEKRG